MTQELMSGRHLPNLLDIAWNPDQGWKFMSCCHFQMLGQLADLASDWLFTLVQPIRSQLAC